MGLHVEHLKIQQAAEVYQLVDARMNMFSMFEKLYWGGGGEHTAYKGKHILLTLCIRETP